MVTPSQAPEAVSPARFRLLLAVLVTAVVVSVMNNSIVAVLLPQIRADFGTSAAAVGWVVTGFSLAFALATAFFGRVSDVFGIRGVFCLGLAIFVAGSAVVALTSAIPVLIAARALQGIGAAAIPALSSVTVARVLPPGRRGLAFGMLATGVGVGQALGPVLGGVAAELAGWRAPFLGTVVLNLPVLLGAWRTLPGRDTEPAGSWRDLDVFGGLLLGSAAALLLVGVTQVQAVGPTGASVWGSVLAAVLLAVAFALRIRAATQPFAPPSLFGNTGFVSASAVGFLALFGFLATIVLVPQMMSGLNGLGSGQVGLVLTPSALAVATLSAAAGRLSDCIGPRVLVLAGLMSLSCSALLLSTIAGGPVWVVATVMVGTGVGLALVISPAMNAAANALPQSQSGVGLGLYQGAIFLGGGAGAAVLSAVVTARAGAAQSWNPLHQGLGVNYSDGFLVIAAVVIVAMLVATRLPGRPLRAAGPVDEATPVPPCS
ncbi:MAG: MFS transporter [Pseudonocardiaceae bacterium]|nr:MFS transporter [Pseudonocardiaceae bacterium]